MINSSAFEINVAMILKTSYAIILSIFAMSLLCLSVYGHARPIIHNPQQNQIFQSIQSIPDKLTIAFSETPEIKASGIKVIDQNNNRIDKNDLSIDIPEKKLSISLDKSKMHTGSYIVKWIVLSKEDGYLTKGAYVFSLNNNNSSNQQQQQTNISNQTLPTYSKRLINNDVNQALSMNPVY
jgi:methionine-rich copper-binding protein CopC